MKASFWLSLVLACALAFPVASFAAEAGARPATEKQQVKKGKKAPKKQVGDQAVKKEKRAKKADAPAPQKKGTKRAKKTPADKKPV